MRSALVIILSLFLFLTSLAQEKPVVKVLTFNILHGATMKGDFDLDVIAKVIIEADADLVALQEVDYKTKRAKGYDLATELGWRTGMQAIFARAMPYDGGEYGEAVLSKHSLIYSRKVDLGYTQGNEPRTALEITTILSSGDTISFIGTHLDHLKEDTDRVKQATDINQAFVDNKHPTILVGDLNDTPGSRAINILEKVWTSTFDKADPEKTFPSNQPRKKIDYIMYRPSADWTVLSSEVICDKVASDHCAYLVTLELNR